MKFFYNIFIILILSFLLFSCGGMKLKKKASSGEEFLIEKKYPLVLPPDFSKLPKPSEQTEVVDVEIDIKSVFTEDEKISQGDENQTITESNIKESISEKIKNQ